MPEAVQSANADTHIREPISEVELRQRAHSSTITPDDVLRLTAVTNGACAGTHRTAHNPNVDYLCTPDANVYDIEFTRFKIRDLDSGHVLFEIAKPNGNGAACMYTYVQTTNWTTRTHWTVQIRTLIRTPAALFATSSRRSFCA
jgi:hypothetical protein